MTTPDSRDYIPVKLIYVFFGVIFTAMVFILGFMMDISQNIGELRNEVKRSMSTTEVIELIKIEVENHLEKYEKESQ